jgi:hypothetical protein
MKELIPLFISLITAVNDGSSPKIVFPNHGARTQTIEYAPASKYTGDLTDDVYDFVPTNNDWNAANYSNNGLTFSYSAVAPASSCGPPDVAGFTAAVNSNSLITALSAPNQATLATFMTNVQSQALIPPTLRTTWSSFITLQNAWLTVVMQNAIVQYAVKYRIPLT